jgi:hypothetical protein
VSRAELSLYIDVHNKESAPPQLSRGFTLDHESTMRSVSRPIVSVRFCNPATASPSLLHLLHP